MAVSQARLDRYRKDLDAIGDAAYSFVDEFVRATMANNPGMSVADLRNEAIDAIDSSLYAFGDQASELALDLFEEIVVDGYGLDADTIIEDVIDPDMIEGGVRYSARQLVEGDTEAFTRDVADLTRYYIKRSAMETMERNCHRNDLRYARVPSGRETCAFCFMLSSRGFVYRSEATAGSAHAYHRNCDCVIVPGFGGLPASEQVKGYDPDGMLDRWHECQAAAGGDSDFRDEWKSMGKKERAKYKGDSDAERYRRFVNAKAMREIETRDWRWLYTGDVPKETYQSSRARDELNATEKLTCKILRENGFKQHVLERSNEHGVKTADILLGASEIRADYKTPRGNGFNSIDQLMRDAGKKADIAIVHLVKGESAMSMDDAIKHFRKCGRRRGITEAIFIDYNEDVRRVKI